MWSVRLRAAVSEQTTVMAIPAVRRVVFRASPRFRAMFERASPGLQRLAHQEVQTLQRRLLANSETGFQTYGSVHGLRTSRVRELELGGGPRALVHYQDGTVTLLAMGSHEVTEKYNRAKLTADLADAAAVDDLILPQPAELVASIFGSHPDTVFEEFKTELAPEWIYFLTEQQNSFVKSSVAAYKRSTADNPSFRFAVGGPGTGKTSVLLKLFVELRKVGARPGIVLTEGVANYVERCSGVGLGNDWVPISEWHAGQRSLDEFGALLLDDPSTPEDIRGALEEVTGTARLAVVGFDPFQLTADLTDDAFDELVAQCDAAVRQFKVCYRQKENVGRAARRVMRAVANATPFLASGKVEDFQAAHVRLGALANSATYPNPHGYEQTYAPATEADARGEIRRIRKAPMWNHSPSVLLVIDDASAAVDWNWSDLLAHVTHVRVGIKWEQHWGYGVWWQLSEVKGLEFQHVLMALSLPAYVEMDIGFAGTGRSNYLARRLARIPFSRAKDSIVTMCAGPADLTRRYMEERGELVSAAHRYGIVDVYKGAPILRDIFDR